MEGFEVIGAGNGRSALEEARKNPPDLIILDIMMPEMDGREVLRELKRDPQTADIQVLMLTVLTGPDEIVRSLEEGAEWHLAKPFDIVELIGLVKRILEVDDKP
jgi:DNA-binding response OmpR family regulator